MEFEGFRLIGHQYDAIVPNSQGWRWSESLDLCLGLEQRKLRYFDAEGNIIPTPEEATDQKRQEKEIAQQRAERLAEKLRSLGVEPDALV